MTTLELKLNLPDRLAREARAAGLLTPEALSGLLEDAMRRRAAQALLAGAARASKSGSKSMPIDEIQAEVNAVRRARKNSARMKLVVDTNILVSAFLWQGTPGRLVEMAGEKECYLFTSRVLMDELADVLQRKKLEKQVLATGLTAAQLLRHYRKLASIITARRLAQQV